MKKDTRKQYNEIASAFSEKHSGGNKSNDKNRLHFYSFLSPFPAGRTLLDVACGDGFDIGLYKTKGFICSGIDVSEAMIEIARSKYPDIDFQISLAENLPYEEASFDIVTSKYAIMTSLDIQPIFNEVHRVLKKGGYFIYLATHPFRQYFEKRLVESDYFQQEIVTSNILDNTISLREPTHTLNEYFSENFLGKFDVLKFEEAFDPAAERIDGRIYPGYFIVLCKKR